MSNYLELIQNVCVVYGKDTTPANFTEASDSDYDLIRLAIKEACQDVYAFKDFRFRERKTTFNTVVGQYNYPNTYGIISEMYLPTYTYPIAYTDDYTALLTSASRQTLPSYTVYNSEIWLYPTPTEIEEVTVLYDSQNWAISSGGYGVGTEKSTMTLETDEPNLPAIHHKLIEYKALIDLLANGQQDKQALYVSKYKQKAADVLAESIGTREASPYIQWPDRAYSNNTLIKDFFRNTI